MKHVKSFQIIALCSVAVGALASVLANFATQRQIDEMVDESVDRALSEREEEA